jgi:hypothetical protein
MWHVQMMRTQCVLIPIREYYNSIFLTKHKLACAHLVDVDVIGLFCVCAPRIETYRQFHSGLTECDRHIGLLFECLMACLLSAQQCMDRSTSRVW